MDPYTLQKHLHMLYLRGDSCDTTVVLSRCDTNVSVNLHKVKIVGVTHGVGTPLHHADLLLHCRSFSRKQDFLRRSSLRDGRAAAIPGDLPSKSVSISKALRSRPQRSQFWSISCTECYHRAFLVTMSSLCWPLELTLTCRNSASSCQHLPSKR